MDVYLPLDIQSPYSNPHPHLIGEGMGRNEIPILIWALV
jgi:hypothetical protein